MVTNSTDHPTRNGLSFLLLLAGLKLLIHLITNIWGGYGIFRDELYYIACSNHPAAGYVDQPPFSIFILTLWRFFAGDSLFALRLLPALSGATTVFIAGLLAREMGGSRFAQTTAALAAIVSPIFLGINTVYSMNSFDVLFWTLAAYLTVRILRDGKPTTWLLLGLVIGIGAFNKIGILWLAGGLGIGFLLPAHRKALRTPAPWVAAGLAFIIFLPYILWNISNDFPHLEFIRNATAEKYAGLTRFDFVAGQFLLNNPVAIPLWLAGLFFFLFSREGHLYKPLGVAYLVVFAILFINGHSKSEYLAPAYTMLFAGGGVMMEKIASRPRRAWIRPALILLLVSGLVFAPAALPLLPVDSYLSYARALGLQQSSVEGLQLDELPQFYADMHGWEEKTDSVAAVFHRLTPADQVRCAIYADNYGRCGAIDFYGQKYGLPRSIGRHNNY